jgi:TPR repeat protein
MKGRGLIPLVVAIVILLCPARLGAEDLDTAFEAYSRGDYATAFREWKVLADKGDAIAEYNLGVLYAGGLGVEQDYAAALKWYQKAAAQGDPDAQNNIGALYENGNGVERDYGEALRWYRMSAEQGLALAQRNVAALYYDGNGVELDYGEALKWYLKAAEQGDATAQYAVGGIYENGVGVERDYQEALSWFRQAAEQGHLSAQTEIGFMYDMGYGVEQNSHEAVRWYRKAAEQGDAIAQYDLGVAYENGTGLAQDYAAALEWYQKAADQGDPDAQNNIGALYEDGNGVARDAAEAMRWYRKAAEQGHVLAQRNIADLYYEGSGVARDYAQAMDWYRKSAEQGDAEAQYELGAMLESGLGAPADVAGALRWYREAAAQDHKQAEEAVARLSQTATTVGPAGAGAATAAAEANLGPAERKAVQQDLIDLGFYDGIVDGAFGAATREAIRSFQRANGFDATGRLTAAQVEMLTKLTAAQKAAAEEQQLATATQTRTGAEADVPAIAIPDDLEPIDRHFTVRESLNVRAEPKLSAALTGTLNPGESVTVLGKVPGKEWYLVGRGETPLGYVAKLQLGPSSSPATAETEPVAQPAALDAFAGVSFGRYHALVIGNDAYKDLPPLATAAADATAIAELLRTHYDFEVEVLIDATREQIMSGLSAFRKRLTAEDNLLIYYAGHGVYDDAVDRGYWLPVDADREVPSNWVSNADITDMVKAMQAKHVLIVADSCYSGTLTRGAHIVLPDGGYIGRMAEKRARTALTSGGLEPVLDSGGGGHSVFARAFLDVLLENDGVLDGQQLFSRVREPIVVNADQTPEYGNIRLAGHDGGDFIFVRRN